MQKIILFFLLFLLSSTCLVYGQEYDFKSFVKSFHDITGDPIGEMNIKGMNNTFFSFTGPFNEITERAKIVFNDMNIPNYCPKVAEEMKTLETEHLKMGGLITRMINEDIILTISWEEELQTLRISEADLSVFR